jgi:glutamyl-tRNA reductase
MSRTLIHIVSLVYLYVFNLKVVFAFVQIFPRSQPMTESNTYNLSNSQKKNHYYVLFNCNRLEILIVLFY